MSTASLPTQGALSAWAEIAWDGPTIREHVEVEDEDGRITVIEEWPALPDGAGFDYDWAKIPEEIAAQLQRWLADDWAC